MIVNSGEVFKAAQVIGSQAQEMCEGVDALLRDWESLSAGWSGAAAAAFAPAWEEWHSGATKLNAMLAAWADRLARAAVAYEYQDCAVAGAVAHSSAGI